MNFKDRLKIRLPSPTFMEGDSVLALTSVGMVPSVVRHVKDQQIHMRSVKGENLDLHFTQVVADTIPNRRYWDVDEEIYKERLSWT